MGHTTFSSLVTSIMLFLAVPAIAVERPSDFGRQWVRSHPFTVMALVLRNQAIKGNDWYSQSGMSTMLAWKHRPDVLDGAVRQNLPCQYHIKYKKPLDDQAKRQINEAVDAYPNIEGFLLWDEPKLPVFPDVAKMVAWVKKNHPEKLVYTNLNPVNPMRSYRYAMPNLAGAEYLGEGVYDETSTPYTYDDHLANLVTMIKPDLVMADVYPFWISSKVDPDWYLLEKYFFMLGCLRKAGLKYGVPYWVFVQSYEHLNRCRYPSESDVRMQVFTTLAYGFTGFVYFTYDPPNSTGSALLKQDMTKAPLYEQVRNLNREVNHLGQTLRFLTSTDVRYMAGTRVENGKIVANDTPHSMALFDTRSRVAKEVRAIDMPSSDLHDNGLITFFRDDEGGLYFMLVNLQHGKDMSAQETTRQFILTFDSSIHVVQRLSRQTGWVERMALDNQQMVIDLPGGTGDLFKIGVGAFPGLE